MSDDERQLLNCCGCCALTFFLISVVIVLLGIMQGVKIHTFVQTRCLVKSSNMETCGVRGGSKVSLRMEQCYQPEWLIEYIDYGQKEETRIKSQYWAKYNGYDDIDQLKSLKMYQIGNSYPCYHSPSDRLTNVQWAKPSLSKFLGYTIGGSITLLLFICSLVSFCCFRRSSTKDEDYGNLQTTRCRTSTITSTAANVKEENVLLYPPSLYRSASNHQLETKNTTA